MIFLTKVSRFQFTLFQLNCMRFSLWYFFLSFLLSSIYSVEDFNAHFNVYLLQLSKHRKRTQIHRNTSDKKYDFYSQQPLEMVLLFVHCKHTHSHSNKMEIVTIIIYSWKMLFEKYMYNSLHNSLNRIYNISTVASTQGKIKKEHIENRIQHFKTSCL